MQSLYSCIESFFEDCSQFSDNIRANCIPAFPILIFNETKNAFFEGLAPSLQPNAITDDDHPFWELSLYHELLHAFHIHSSSLGFVYSWISTSKYKSAKVFSEELRKAGIDHANLQDKLEILKRKNDTFKNWKNFEEFKRVNFCSTKNGVVPRISTVIPAFNIYLLSTGILNEHYEVRVKDYSDYYTALCRQLCHFSDTPVEAIFDPSTDFEGTDIKRDIPQAYLPSHDLIRLSVYDIIEGYARMVEKFFYFEKLVWSGVAKEEAKNVVESFYQERGIPEDYTAITIIEKYLGDKFCSQPYEQQLVTISAIFDVSIMTRSHPVLIYSDNKVDYKDFFIPLRFKKILNFMKKTSTTLLDYYALEKIDNSSILQTSHYMNALDSICAQAGFLSYTESIKTLIAFYSHEHFKKEHTAIYSKKALALKINQPLIFPKFKDLLDLPATLVFSDASPTICNRDKNPGFAKHVDGECFRNTAHYVFNHFMSCTLKGLDVEHFEKFFKRKSIALEHMSILNFYHAHELDHLVPNYNKIVEQYKNEFGDKAFEDLFSKEAKDKPPEPDLPSKGITVFFNEEFHTFVGPTEDTHFFIVKEDTTVRVFDGQTLIFNTELISEDITSISYDPDHAKKKAGDETIIYDEQIKIKLFTTAIADVIAMVNYKGDIM